MRIYWYRCPTCGAERLFTQAQHDAIENVGGWYLRERRDLVRHVEPTPEDGRSQLGDCVGHLWLYATLNGECVKAVAV